MGSNSIIFKGVKDGIQVILDNEISFEELMIAFKKKLQDSKTFFQDANTSIIFKGRNLTEDEEINLLRIISKYSGLEISFLKNQDYPVPSNNENKINQKNNSMIEQTIQQIPNTLNTSIPPKSMPTYFHKGAVRSGQCLEFEGSIVVIGDVNPGSKIIAEGNIIILGKLKGIVHAGCKGNKECFVSALNMNPTQLIIGDVITYFPSDITRTITPEYAYQKNGQIFVQQLSV